MLQVSSLVFSPRPHFASIRAITPRLTSRRLTFPCSEVGRVLVCVYQTGETSVQTKDTCDATSEIEDCVEEVPVQLFLEATNPSTEALIGMSDAASRRIISILRADGVTLNLETEHQEWRECVGELQDATGTDDNDPTVDLGDGLTDHPRTAPIERHKEDEDPFALLRLENGEPEHVTTQVVVKNLDANVAVEHSSDDTGEEFDDVANGLPGVWGYALV